MREGIYDLNFKNEFLGKLGKAKLVFLTKSLLELTIMAAFFRVSIGTN